MISILKILLLSCSSHSVQLNFHNSSYRVTFSSKQNETQNLSYMIQLKNLKIKNIFIFSLAFSPENYISTQENQNVSLNNIK